MLLPGQAGQAGRVREGNGRRGVIVAHGSNADGRDIMQPAPMASRSAAQVPQPFIKIAAERPRPERSGWHRGSCRGTCIALQFAPLLFLLRRPACLT